MSLNNEIVKEIAKVFGEFIHKHKKFGYISFSSLILICGLWLLAPRICYFLNAIHIQKIQSTTDEDYFNNLKGSEEKRGWNELTTDEKFWWHNNHLQEQKMLLINSRSQSDKAVGEK